MQAREKADVEIPFSFLPQVVLFVSPLLILVLDVGQRRRLLFLVVDVFETA